MKNGVLRGYFLVAMILSVGSCSRKQTVPPATTPTLPTATPTPSALATQATTAKPLSAASSTPAMPLPTPAATPSTPPPLVGDITTQAGFLGKSKNMAQQAAGVVSKINAQDKQTPITNLSFQIHNVSGTTLYATCFAYVRPRRFNRWRWRKSDVKEIKAGEKTTINVRTLDDAKDKKHVFGALAVFPNKLEAESATYELLRDENKLDLDILHDIQDQTVVIGIERYGFREPFYDYDFVDEKKKGATSQAELDFFVQNQTGRTVLVTGFIYTKKAKGRWIAAEDEKDDMSVWRFYKTKVLRLEAGQTGYIDVDSVIPKRDRTYVRGYLGVFGENQEDEAHNKTYELLSDQEKINLGPLSSRQGRTIILEVERYGVANDIIDFTVKPIKWIDFTKIVH